MGKKLDMSLLAKMKDDFQLGLTYEDIAYKYKIGIGTVHRYAKNGDWKRLEEKLVAITDSYSDLEKSFENKATLLEKFEEKVNIKRALEDFVSKALRINLKNLEDAEKEKDHHKRILQVNAMKATVKDIAEMSKIHASMSNIADALDTEKSVVNEDQRLIVEYVSK